MRHYAYMQSLHVWRSKVILYCLADLTPAYCRGCVLTDKLFYLTQAEGFYHEDIFGVTLKTAEVTIN